MTVRTVATLKSQMYGKKTMPEIENWRIDDLLDTLEAILGSYDTANTSISAGLLQAGDCILSKTDVSLATAAQTTLYTVPAGKTLVVTGIQIVGKVVPTGSTKVAKLLIGTTAGSYAELLNGSTGYAIDTATATTLLAVGAILNAFSFYVPANVSVAPTAQFAAASVIKADVSTGGSLPTTGTVTVIVRGYLV